MVQITPEFVNGPKPGKSWGNIKIAGGKIYLSEWSNIAHCQPGSTYECNVEEQEWKDRQNPGQVSVKTVIVGYAQPVGEMALQPPPTAPQAGFKPDLQITPAPFRHNEPNGARVGMFFNALKELKLSGLDIGDTEMLEWYKRAIILSNNAGTLLDSDSN